MTDPTAQMGFQVGQTALKHGSEYVEQNVSSTNSVPSAVLIWDLVQSLCQCFCSQALFQRVEERDDAEEVRLPEADCHNLNVALW